MQDMDGKCNKESPLIIACTPSACSTCCCKYVQYCSINWTFYADDFAQKQIIV